MAAVSSFYPDPGELHRAIKEAELVLDVITREPEIAEALEEGIAASGVYRLLFRALISDPDEVRSFYRDTVEPLVRYDDQYRSDLLGTLEEYLASDCNMNATARAIFAHRHTVAYRLDRVKELTRPRPADLRGPGAARPRHQGVPDPGAGAAALARHRTAVAEPSR